MKKSEEERIKLTASFLNGIAVACVSIGFVTPLVAALYHFVNAIPVGMVLLFGAGWLLVGLALHTFGLWYLGDIDP